MNIFHRACAKLFDWHYVAYDFASDWEVCRIRYMPNGRAYIKCCGIHFLDDAETRRFIRALTFADDVRAA